MVNKFAKKLEEIIARIEATSHIEIVASYRETATRYTGWYLFYSAIVAIFVYECVHAATLQWWSKWAVLLPILTTLAAFFAVYAFMRKGFYFSCMIPKVERQKAALLEASKTFLVEGLTRAGKGLGILVNVYHKEKIVLILADHGFQGHVPEDYWPKLGIALAKDFSSNQPAEEFFQAFEKLEKEVAPKFPLAPGEKKQNKVSNKLRS